MKDNHLKSIFVISGAYISVILGAGFISGQELLFFFGRFGKLGFLGLGISCFLFSAICYKQLTIIHRENVPDYHSFTHKVMGYMFVHIGENISMLFMLVILATMFSAGGATINEAFGFNYNISIILIGSITFISLLQDVDGVISINSLLAPLMIVGGIVVGIYTYFFSASPVFSTDIITKSVANNSVLIMIISAVLYTSYNSITSISLLSNLKEHIYSHSVITISSIISGVMLFILGSILLLPLNLHHIAIAGLQIPVLGMLKVTPSTIKYVYLLVLICAIFTTAISSGISIIKTVSRNIKVNSVIAKAILIIVALALSQIGFSNFVSKVYPIFGVFGFIQILKILIYTSR